MKLKVVKVVSTFFWGVWYLGDEFSSYLLKKALWGMRW